jgi:uncharacterized protein with GYD domain
MAIYLTRFAYTAAAWAALAKNPVDRGKVLGSLLERLGGRLLGLYYILGDEGGVFLYEMPDDTAASAAIIAALAPGHVKAINTHRLLTIDETLAALRQAGAVTYQAPAAG